MQFLLMGAIAPAVKVFGGVGPFFQKGSDKKTTLPPTPAVPRTS